VDCHVRPWTSLDSEVCRSRLAWTDLDAHGPGLEICGSGGWGFESLRACHAKPLLRKGFRMLEVYRPSDVWEPFHSLGRATMAIGLATGGLGGCYEIDLRGSSWEWSASPLHLEPWLIK